MTVDEISNGAGSMLVRVRDVCFGVLGCLLAIVVWFLSGGVFHRTLNLFTRLDTTAINILSCIGGFLIMTACTVIVGYIRGRIMEHRSR